MLEDDLFEIEQGFWLEGEAHFLSYLDERCLLAFPQGGELHGPAPREIVAATASAPGRWRDLRITDRQWLQPSAEVAFISYRADVKRADGTPYHALVSSAYVRRADRWKLAFHQHSPIP